MTVEKCIGGNRVEAAYTGAVPKRRRGTCLFFGEKICRPVAFSGKKGESRETSKTKRRNILTGKEEKEITVNIERENKDKNPPYKKPGIGKEENGNWEFCKRRKNGNGIMGGEGRGRKRGLE